MMKLRAEALSSLIAMIAGCNALDEPPRYPVNKTVTKTWAAGLAPNITIEFSGGWLDVVPSRDGEVKASLRISAATNTSEADTLRLIRNSVMLEGSQTGEAIRISAIDTMPRSSLWLIVSVPEGSHLDVHSEWGMIRAGYDPNSGAPIAFSPRSFKARTDRLGGIDLNINRTLGQIADLQLDSEELALTVDGVPIDPGPTGLHGQRHYRSK